MNSKDITKHSCEVMPHFVSCMWKTVIFCREQANKCRFVAVKNRASLNCRDALFDTRDRLKSLVFSYCHAMHPAARFLGAAWVHRMFVDI